MVPRSFGYLLASPAWAQNRIPIQILVEELSDEPCGLTTDAISGRVRLTLRQYGFTEITDSDPFIYIKLNSLELGSQCIGDSDIEIVGFTAQDLDREKHGWVKKAATRRTVLARAGNIFTYPRYEFPAKALNTVEAQVKTVLGKIEY